MRYEKKRKEKKRKPRLSRESAEGHKLKENNNQKYQDILNSNSFEQIWGIDLRKENNTEAITLLLTYLNLNSKVSQIFGEEPWSSCKAYD